MYRGTLCVQVSFHGSGYVCECTEVHYVYKFLFMGVGMYVSVQRYIMCTSFFSWEWVCM